LKAVGHYQWSKLEAFCTASGRKYVDDEHPVVRTIVRGVLVLAAVWTFFASPLITFEDASDLASAGMFLGTGASIGWISLRLGWGRRWEWASIAVILVGVALVGLQSFFTAQTYKANNKRCISLQQDMLSATPKRADGPSLFAALRCRPSGTQPVAFKSAAPAISPHQGVSSATSQTTTSPKQSRH
jgi:hypothetical protein